MNQEEKPPLWNYIRLSEYARPSAPTTEAIRIRMGSLWRRWQRDEEENVQIELDSLPQTLLDRVASPPEWDGASDALDRALGEWLDSRGTDDRVRVVVGAPSGGSKESVGLWTNRRQWRIVEAPAPDEILAGGKEWIAQLDEGSEAQLVFPNLGRFYLRHYDGLTLLGRLLDWLWSSQCRCVIECESWSWAFLSKALQIDSAFPNPLTLEAFDHERLSRWFTALASEAGADVVFRQADNGKLVMPHEDAGDREQAEVTDFLRHLASHSRGNPGVAWAIWRHSLRVSADEGVEDEQEGATDGRGRTIWVEPWSRLELPEMPDDVGQNEIFILQALLLDGDASAQLLSRMLSISFANVMHGLQRLHTAGLVEVDAGIWKVATLGYPAVRQHLNNAGYLVDAL